ncbi:hypothetical protein EFR50_05585, partial [Lactobacillus delbrueckii subsp. lactis]|uniref:hypothetical protein n=1 Tax=Lactobacillus delbrueckii TaxID=1584 RepID=UPI0021A543D2
LTPNLTAFTGVDSQNLPDVMVSVQFILAIGANHILVKNGQMGKMGRKCFPPDKSRIIVKIE